MKYTIEGFLQEKLLALSLDVLDALILRWFIDFAGTGNMKKIIHDHQIYYYVKYAGIISDLPVLGISSTKGIGNRFDRYVEKKLLAKTVKRQGNGTLLFFAPTRKLLELQYNSTMGTAVPFVESPPNLKDGYIQNELDFESDTGNKAPEKEAKNCEKQQNTEKARDAHTLKGTGVPISTTKGTPVAFRKEPQFPSERNSSSLALNNSSTRNSSTTDSLTTEYRDNALDKNSAAAVLKNEFEKRISVEIFSPDFWDNTAQSLSENNLMTEDLVPYVDFLFDYAQAKKPKNLTHYLYKTAGAAYMVSEFFEHKKNQIITITEDKQKHLCASCLNHFDSDTCPYCGLETKDLCNEEAIKNARRRFKGNLNFHIAPPPWRK